MPLCSTSNNEVFRWWFILEAHFAFYIFLFFQKHFLCFQCCFFCSFCMAEIFSCQLGFCQYTLSCRNLSSFCFHNNCLSRSRCPASPSREGAGYGRWCHPHLLGALINPYWKHASSTPLFCFLYCSLPLSLLYPLIFSFSNGAILRKIALARVLCPLWLASYMDGWMGGERDTEIAEQVICFRILQPLKYTGIHHWSLFPPSGSSVAIGLL